LAVPDDLSTSVGCVLRPTGELDMATAPAAFDPELLPPSATDVYVDLCGVSFMDVYAVNRLVRLRSVVLAAGGWLDVVGVHRQVARVFRLTGFGDLLNAEQDRIEQMERAAEAGYATISHLTAALETSRRIGAAIGVIMATEKLSESQAFEVLRVESQLSHRKLRDIADNILMTGKVRR
jgi:anti-anti-sigma factor